MVDATALTKDERSFLLYAESCCVDGGGLLVGERMNADDRAAAKRFVSAGWMRYGRIPAALLGMRPSMDGANLPTRPRGVTDWCELTDEGWRAAHQCRRNRASRRGPFATLVFEETRHG